MQESPEDVASIDYQRQTKTSPRRVENPRELAVRILGISRKEVDALIDTGENQAINLKRKVPVHIGYFNAWPDATEEIAYYADIYGRDARLEKALSAIAIAAK
jgi:murein L,D-transpeptidase YcbB/YkuD